MSGTLDKQLIFYVNLIFFSSKRIFYIIIILITVTPILKVPFFSQFKKILKYEYFFKSGIYYYFNKLITISSKIKVCRFGLINLNEKCLKRKKSQNKRELSNNDRQTSWLSFDEIVIFMYLMVFRYNKT